MVNDRGAFGNHLKTLIKAADMTQDTFYTKLGITKSYFYDVVSGKINPIPPRLQFEAVRILKLDDAEKQVFFDMAAKERGEMPADITKIVTENPQVVTGIRGFLKQVVPNK